MKICLIYADNNISAGTEHLGIAYITAYLKKHGYVVDLYDCTAMQMDLNHLLAILKRERYDVVGLSCYQDNYLYTLRIILYLRSIKADTFIFIGGYLPTLSIEKLKPNMNIIDCAIMGEGEEITLQLIRNIETGNWKKTDGIAYMVADRLVLTEKGSRVEQLDELPFPVRVGKNRNNFNIIASRGCTGNCSFCSIRSFSKHNDCQRIRRRSPHNIVSEIESCIETADFDADTPIIFFYDEQFFSTDKARGDWFDEFYRIMRHRKLGVRFNCQLRADQVKENYDRLLKFQKIGLVGVFVGIESFLQKHLDYYRKGTSVQTNLEAVELLSSMKLTVRIGYLLFNPLTTLDDILQTIQFFRRHQINKNKIILDNMLSASVMISYPGTPVEQTIHKNHDFALNLRGYRIRDTKSELCYQIMGKWNQLLENSVKNIADGIYQSQEKEALLSELFYLDLEVLETVCLALRQRLRAIDYFDSYFDRALLTARKIINSTR